MTTSCSTNFNKIFIIGGTASMMLNFRKELIIELASKGNEVFCMANDYTVDQKIELESWGAKAIESPLNPKGLNPWGDVVAVYKLKKILNLIQPDVVFSYFVKPVIFGSIAARVVKIPRVVGMIEGLGNAFMVAQEEPSKKQQIIKRITIALYRLVLPKLDQLILLNHDDKKDLVETYDIKVNKLEVLGGIGLDLERFSYRPANTLEVSFIFIARLLKEKGVFEYLQAAEKVKRLHPEVKFYMLGGFDTQNPFALKKQELEEYLQKGTVIYPGHVDNVPEWIAKSSVFVLPSFYREGLPRSTQEAMAIGRPIITTDSVGCKETVDDGLNGFLVPPFSPDEIVKKMLFFIEHPEKITEMGLKSREMAEQKYDVHVVNRRLINLILGDE